MPDASADSSGLQLLHNLGIDPTTTARLLDLFKETLEATLKKTLAEMTIPFPLASQSPGTELKPQDKIKAADLRIAMLMGKLPEDSGILIDTKTLAQLLSISTRHLTRLKDLKAVPEPVHLGFLIRWRLAEILEWIDSDCPSQKVWDIKKQESVGRKRK